MIREYVVCDWCADLTPMDRGMVPDSVYAHDGRHYCTAYCLSRADRNLSLTHWASAGDEA